MQNYNQLTRLLITLIDLYDIEYKLIKNKLYNNSSDSSMYRYSMPMVQMVCIGMTNGTSTYIVNALSYTYINNIIYKH